MLINLSNNQILASKMGQAYTFLRRLKGLMFTKDLPTDCALHIRPCRSVHTFFMNYSIDVLYLNANYKIVAIDEQLCPGKVGKMYAEAVSVIELPAGTARRTDTQIGHVVQLLP